MNEEDADDDNDDANRHVNEHATFTYIFKCSWPQQLHFTARRHKTSKVCTLAMAACTM